MREPKTKKGANRKANTRNSKTNITNITKGEDKK